MPKFINDHRRQLEKKYQHYYLLAYFSMYDISYFKQIRQFWKIMYHTVKEALHKWEANLNSHII